MSGRDRRTSVRGTAGRTLLAGLLAASGVGVAQAYYVGGGTGSGTGGTGTVAAIALSSATVVDALYPGETATVSLTATNQNAADVRIGSLVLDTSQGTSGFAREVGSASCALTAFTYAVQTNGGDGWTVPAGGSLAIDLIDAVTASSTTASACQGATLTVYLKAAA